MMFWADSTGLQRFYKGWKVLMCHKPKDAKTRLSASIQKELEWLQEYMSVDTVTFLIPVKNQQYLAVYATIGLEEEIAQQIRIPIGQGFAGRIAASMTPIVVNDFSKIEIFSPILRQKNLKSLAGVPVPLEENLVGVLHVGTYRYYDFTERDLHQLQLVGYRISWIFKDAGFFNEMLGSKIFANSWNNTYSILTTKIVGWLASKLRFWKVNNLCFLS
jgi:signal transduction protein with GAF and PtsI domain